MGHGPDGLWSANASRMAKNEFPRRDPAGGPTGPGPRVQPADIQPPSGAADSVEVEEPDGFAEVSAERSLDDYLARIVKDQEMVQELQWGGYKGKLWDDFVAVLVDYGYSVFVAWIQTGLIYQRCREQGLQGLPDVPPGAMTTEDVEELARDTVADAVVAFRDKVLKPHLWSPSGGASLKTFFVGRGLIEFVGILRKWVAARRFIPTENAALFERADPFPHSDPERVALARVELERVSAAIDDHITIRVFSLRAAGYRHHEIAEMVDLPSAKAVESLIYRTKRAQRNESA